RLHGRQDPGREEGGHRRRRPRREPRPAAGVQPGAPGVPEGRASDVGREESVMATVQVRYIVHDVDAAIAFCTRQLGFQLVMHPAPAFAMLTRGDLRLALSAPNPAGGGGQSMPDGTQPEPGGWNRFAIEVEDIDSKVGELRAAGAKFRNDVV